MRIRIQPFVAPVTSSEGIPVSPTNGTQLSLLRLSICTFGLMSWLQKHVGFSGISLPCTRFETIRSIGNSMHHNGFQQLMIQHIPVV